MSTLRLQSEEGADPPEREILNVVDPQFSQCGGPTYEGE